jgi:hypothetical protein
VVVKAGASFRLQFPDGAAMFADWDDLLGLANAGVKLVTVDGREITGLHAIARQLPR